MRRGEEEAEAEVEAVLRTGGDVDADAVIRRWSRAVW